MNGETDLGKLLASMQPALNDLPYVFCTLDWDQFNDLPFTPLCTFHEQEGITVIMTQMQAVESAQTVDGLWACITLTVHSSLTAVGFLAAITTRLAEAGISVNAVSAYYHDHLFVPWENRFTVMEILGEITGRNEM